MKFYICKHCGNIIIYLHRSGVPVSCCGEKMQELVPGTTEGAQEKHIPLVKIDGNVVNVKVGEAAHPMETEHFIQWVILETDRGWQKRELAAGDAAEAVFWLGEGEKAVAAYEYCNLHGLWGTRV